MSSTQSEETCPECHFEAGMMDFNCRSGEEDFFCDRCGYVYHLRAVLDEATTREKYAAAKRLLLAGDYDAALKEAGRMGLVRWTPADGHVPISAWSVAEKEREIKDFLRRCEDTNFLLCYKLKDGKITYEELEEKHTGCVRARANGAIATSIEGYDDLNDLLTWLANVKEHLQEASYTTKEAGGWVRIDALTGKRTPLPDDYDRYAEAQG